MVPKPMKNQSNWKLVAYDPPDASQARALAAFVRSQQARPEDYPTEKNFIFAWKLLHNRSHPGFATVMLTEDKNEIVSLCTITPKRLWFEGKEVLWAEIGDTFTDHAFRHRGMFASLVDATRQRAQTAGYKIIYGLPNEQSAPGYIKKLNFGIKQNLDLVNCTLALRSHGIAWWLGSRKPHGSWLFSKIIALLENSLFEAAFQKMSRILLPHSPIEGIVVREERSFGPMYDDLWRRLQDVIPVAQVRDADYLTWRYIDNPFPFTILAALHNDRLEGYLITLVQWEDKQKISRLYLMDWLFSPRDTFTIGMALMKAALDQAYQNNVSLVTALAPRRSSIPLPLKRFVFFKRPWGAPCILHLNEDGCKLINGSAPWHFTLGDTDGF